MNWAYIVTLFWRSFLLEYLRRGCLLWGYWCSFLALRRKWFGNRSGSGNCGSHFLLLGTLRFLVSLRHSEQGKVLGVVLSFLLAHDRSPTIRQMRWINQIFWKFKLLTLHHLGRRTDPIPAPHWSCPKDMPCSKCAHFQGAVLERTPHLENTYACTPGTRVLQGPYCLLIYVFN